MNKSTFSSLIATLFCILSFAQNLNQPIPVNPEVEIGQLDNGLTYYLQNNPKPDDIVELRMVVNTGSVMEDDDQLGLAHFLEHMAFNGTKSFEKNDIVSYLQSIGVEFGADLNAYTSFDETVYILPIPSENFENIDKGFQILKEMIFDMTLHPEDIDAERGVVIEEYRTSLGAQWRMIKKYLPEMMYGSKYAERLPIGTKESLETFTYESLRRFYKDWYRPDLMALIVVGDIEVRTMKELVAKYFEDVPKPVNPRERVVYSLPNHPEPKISSVSDEEAFVNTVQVMYKDLEDSEPMTTVGDYKTYLIDRLFSNMINGRLDELATSSNPPFLNASSSYGSGFARTKKMYTSSATSTNAESLPATITALLTENKRVLEHGFLSTELERAKQNILTTLENQVKEKGKQNSSRFVSQYIRHFLEKEPIPGIDWEYENAQKIFDNIKLKEVSDRINDYVHSENMVVVVQQKEEEGKEIFDNESVREIMEVVENAEVVAYQEDEIRSNLIEVIPEAGSIVSKSYDEKLGVTKLELSNGIQVRYKQTDFKNDQILFQAYSKGGVSLLSNEELKPVEIALQLNANAQAGYGGLSVSDLEKLMSGNTASLSSSVGQYSEELSGNSSPEDIQSLLQMIYLHHTGLNKNADFFHAFINNVKGFYKGILSNPEFYFQIAVAEEKNIGNDRFNGFPSDKDFDAISYDKTYDFHVDRFADANDFTYYFVGNFEADALEELVEIYLGSLPVSNEEDEIIVPDFRQQDAFKEFIVQKGTDPKSFVNIDWIEDIDFDQNVKFAASALSDVVTNKLIEKLRESESGVYGVGARSNFNEIPYPLFPCGPDRAKELIDYSIALIADIKTNGIAVEDLEKVKESLRVDYKENIEQNSYWLSYLKNTDQYGRDPYRLFSYLEKVDALTTEDLQNVAINYLDENYFLSILYPEEVEDKVVEAVENDMTANGVITQYLNAIGGTDLIHSIQSLEISYRANFMGNDLEATSINSADEQKQIIKMGGNVLATVIVNAAGATVEQMGNSMDLPPDMAADMQAVIGVIPELKMLDNENVTLTGIEEVDGQKAYAVVMKGQTTTTTTYYAVESGLKLKQITSTEMMGQTQTQESSYGNYKSFGGLMIPTSTSVPLGPQAVDATLGDVKINGASVSAE
jgi:zinc protease